MFCFWITGIFNIINQWLHSIAEITPNHRAPKYVKFEPPYYVWYKRPNTHLIMNTESQGTKICEIWAPIFCPIQKPGLWLKAKHRLSSPKETKGCDKNTLKVYTFFYILQLLITLVGHGWKYVVTHAWGNQCKNPAVWFGSTVPNHILPDPRLTLGCIGKKLVHCTN